MYIWNEKDKPTTMEEGFYSNVTRNYNGHKFMYVAFNVAIPSFYCTKPLKSFEEVQPGEDSLEESQCIGSEVLNLGFAKEMFNMSWGLIAPKYIKFTDPSYSQIDNLTGRWNPNTYNNHLIYGKADISLFTPTDAPGNRILGGTKFIYQPYFIFSAAPKKLSNVFAVIYPFEPILWPAIFLAATLMSIAFYILPNFQRTVDVIKGLDPKKEKGVLIWFGYFALIGENMRQESIEYHRGPIR